MQTQGILFAIDSPMIRVKVEHHLSLYFPIKYHQRFTLPCLNYRTIQSEDHISTDQTCCIMKVTKVHFNNYLNLTLPKQIHYLELIEKQKIRYKMPILALKKRKKFSSKKIENIHQPAD